MGMSDQPKSAVEPPVEEVKAPPSEPWEKMHDPASWSTDPRGFRSSDDLPPGANGLDPSSDGCSWFLWAFLGLLAAALAWWLL